jgi:hypothetical protein
MSTRGKDFEQQLAQLRWRRNQNERLIREALEATKVLKQKDTILGLTADQSVDKSLWMTQVLRDELSRPLIISDEELHRVQYEDSKIKKRLLKYSKNQLENIDRQAHAVQNRFCKTSEGEKVKEEQLEQLFVIKEKLKENIKKIETKTPFINVKQVLEKTYT